PGDAIIYVGWRGTDALGATYDNSHLAAVIAATNFAGLSEQTIPALLSKLPQEKPEEIERAAAIEAAIPLLLHLWNRPTAFFVAAKNDARGDFEPRIGLICDAGAGESAVSFHKSLAELVAKAKDDNLKTAIEGSLVIVTLGYDDPAALLKTKQP